MLKIAIIIATLALLALLVGNVIAVGMDSKTHDDENENS